MESYSKFHNEVGVPIVRIGCREFKCIGDKPPQDHPHVYLNMGEASEIVCPYCSTLFRFDQRLAAHEAARRIVRITVTWTLSAMQHGPHRAPFYGRYEWKRTRRQVRLAAGFKCSMCGELTPQGLHVHHRKTTETRAGAGLRTVEPDDVVHAVPQPRRTKERNATTRLRH